MWTLVAAALGTWLGIQSARMALAMIIWNTAEDNTTLAGEQAALLWIVGLAGAFIVRVVPLRRREIWLAVLFGALIVLRQALPGENSSPAFAYAAWAVWMWWLPAFIERSGGELVDLATGVVLGVLLQVAGQISLHGLDLELLRGAPSVIAAAVLAVLLVLALRARVPSPGGGAWGAFALGPFLFLELTLLSSLGRVEVTSGLAPIVTQLAVVAGFVIALVLLAVGVPRSVRLGVGALAIVVLVPGTRLGALEPLQLVVGQAGLVLALAAAFTTGPSRWRSRVYVGTTAGLIAFFALVFVFYSYRDRGEALWPVAALLVVAPSVFVTERWRTSSWRPAIAAAVAALGAIALASLPPPQTPQPAIARAAGELAVLQYNVHQGLDFWSVPSAEALVDRIESANADLVALQEVNRGWDLSAGIDFFSYVRWRLPQYHAVYGPMDTPLFGNAILSRYAIVDSGDGILPHLNSALNRGFTWANVDAPGGRVFFVSTHFTAYEGFDAERIAQADAFVGVWQKRSRAILAGDYNAHPQDTTITRLVSAGLVDAPAAAGIGAQFTYSSGAPHERIDYVFVSPDVETVSARVLEGTASDHSPVMVVLRLR